MPPTITDLDELVAGLAPKDRARFDRLYAFNRSTACVLPPKTMEDLGHHVRELVGSKSLLLVREEKEMSLFVAGEGTINSSIATQELLDTTGVRDTIVSAFALALVAGADYKTAMAVTHAAAAKVATKVGTATVTLEELAAG